MDHHQRRQSCIYPTQVKTHNCHNIMKHFSILLCLMSFVGCKAADFRSVDAETFAQVIKDTTVVRLDVRTANEYTQGHIPNNISILLITNPLEESNMRYFNSANGYRLFICAFNE